jgi:hypothetical protein
VPYPRQLALFRAMIEPELRRPHRRSFTETVGDVLDQQPETDVCRVRERRRSSANQTMWIYHGPCGLKSCPICVVDWLAKRVGAAWCYWGGEARYDIFFDDGHNNVSRQMRDVGIRFIAPRTDGEGPTLGALSLPYGDGVGDRAVFWPGRGLRGAELDERLRSSVRAVLLVDPDAKPREQPDPRPRSRIPDKRAYDYTEIWEEVGGKWDRRGRFASSATDELVKAFDEALWVWRR